MIAASLKRFSVIHNHCSKPSPLTSRPSTWSIPRFSFIDRRASSVMSQSITKSNSDLNTTEVTLKTSDSNSIPQSNPPDSLSQDRQNHRAVREIEIAVEFVRGINNVKVVREANIVEAIRVANTDGDSIAIFVAG